MRTLQVILGLCLLNCVSGLGFAQNSQSSDIRGTATDPSGAILPGVTVTVLNNDTGVTRVFVTNADGLYDTNSILPGTYTVTFTKAGFEKLVKNSIVLQVGLVTVDGTMKVGSVSQEVVVTSNLPLLKTEDAQVNTTLSTQQLTDLPNVDPGNGWTYLLKLLPGATSTPNINGNGSGDQEPGADQAIAGTMPYFSSYLVDGGSIWLPHSANIDSGQSETVAEVDVITSTASAQYGGGGNVFNVISKSGTNRFHGALYEYFQNDDLNARSYFNAAPQAKAKQRFNYFGGSLGGPVIKEKLFFYFNYQKLENPENSVNTVSVPTSAMKAGCFDPTLFGTNLTLDPKHGSTPLTTNAAQCGSFNPADLALPTAYFDPVAVNIQNTYPAPNLSGIASNYTYLKPSNGNSNKTFGRLDWNMSAKNRIDISVTQHSEPNKTNYDPGPVCPVLCENNSGEAYQAQITDVYALNPSMVNEFRYSFVRQGNWFVPQTFGQGYPAKLGLQFSYADVFPTVNINGTGAPLALGPGTNAVFIENTFIPSDVFTLVRGKHILHFGGEVMFAQDNSTPWGSIIGADVTFTGQYTTNSPTVDVGYADFLLGDVQQWSTSTQPEHGMREKNPSFFVQDDIKLRPNVTVNLGLRFETHGGFSEVQNHMGGFDPTITNPVTNTLGSVWFAGQNGARTKNFETKTIVMPRLGMAWQATENWVVRGGVGQYSSLWSMDTVGGPLGFGTGVTGTATANAAYSATGVYTGAPPVVQLSGSGAGLPTISGTNPASYITPADPQGNGFIPYTPYNLHIMNGWQWTVSAQRRLPAKMVAEAQYVGSHWVNQMFEADINQVPADRLALEGGATPVPAQTLRPFPQFSGIGIGSGGSRTGQYSGKSNYESAQFLLHKPFGYGLSADLSYSWSQLKDDMDSSGWGNQFGAVYYQDAYNISPNYALSNFDRPNSFKGSLIYAIPLGKGHQYMSSALGDAALGGWQASTAFLAQSGVPFTVIMNSATPDGALDGSLYPNRVGNPHASNQSLLQWFNQLAYAPPAALTFGTNPRNSLRAPDLTDVDFSLAKNFDIPRWEQGRVQLRMDAFNFFNHPSFQPPNNSLNPTALTSGVPDPSVGNITATSIGGRTIQLAFRLSF
jgi:Carboxypeptidase regulatory-like domain